MAASTVLFYFALTYVSTGCGFNLEPRIPVAKRGMPGSYFGYSVAQHQSIDDSGAVINNW